MKKRVVLSVMLILIIALLVLSLVSCKDSVFIVFDYVITSQFSRMDEFDRGSLLNKPENPSYRNDIFTPGRGKSYNGYVSSDVLSIQSPRLNDGFSHDKNYIFDGWYTEPEYNYKWNFAEDRIYGDMTLYAKWIEE